MDADRMFLALVRSTLGIRKDDVKQWKLAQRLDIDGTLLSRYLRGRRPMPEEVKKKLIAELCIDRLIDAQGEGAPE
jgi:hypothetical protein